MRICVFSGSNPGVRSSYREAAVQLGEYLASQQIGLVYGGGGIGLMKVVADAVRSNGGTVIGVIPQALVDCDVAHKGLDDLRIVKSMHERKALMAELADGFIALPGGIGTLEEIFEAWTWAQLGHHTKPCGLLNVEGYFDGLLAFLDHMVAEEFLRPKHRGMLMVEREPKAMIEAFSRYTPPILPKWNRESAPQSLQRLDGQMVSITTTSTQENK